MLKMMNAALAGLAALCLTSSVWSQDDAFSRTYAEEYELHPQKAAQFEASWKKIMSTARANGYPFEMRVASWRSTVWVFTSINSLDDIDRMQSERRRVFEAGGAEFATALEGLWEATRSDTNWVDYSAADLSYAPADYTPSTSAPGILKVEVMRFKPTKAFAIRPFFAEVRAEFARLEVPYPYELSFTEIGSSTNEVAMVEWADDMVAMAKRTEEMDALFQQSDQMNRLYQRFLTMVDDVETVYATPRPDLSYSLQDIATAAGKPE